MDEAQQIILERLRELPRKARERFISGEFTAAVSVVADKYGLDDEEKTKLEKEVLVIFLGFEPVLRFVANLTDAFGLPEETALAMAEDINWLLFPRLEEAANQETEDEIVPGSIFARMRDLRERDRQSEKTFSA